jgi:hypothetical protein
MIGTIMWLALGGACVLIEVRARRHPQRTATIARVGGLIARHRAGRALLVLAWVFVGVHFFTRYTLPGHG